MMNNRTLTDAQKNAIDFFKKKARITSKSVYLECVAKYASLGYCEQDLQDVINYVKKYSRFIIHINLDNLIGVLESNKYMNRFEARGANENDSYYAYRRAKELSIFNNIYKDVSPTELCKYGSLSMFCNKTGQASCRMYGNCYIMLKKDVNDRISFLYGNSSTAHLYIQTIEHFNNLLLFLPDNDTHKLVEMAKESKINQNISSNYDQSIYVEAQIHGDIIISDDIELVYTPTFNNHINDRCRTMNISYTHN